MSDVQTQMDAKLHELTTAEASVVSSYNSTGSSLLTIGGADIGDYILQAQQGIDTLSGDLYYAVLGQMNFPLDTGTAPDPTSALAAWNALAVSTQNLLSNELHYTATWGPLPFAAAVIKQVGQQLTSPTLWPWWLQAAAGAAILYFGAKMMGAAGEAKKAWSGYRAASRGRKPRRYW